MSKSPEYERAHNALTFYAKSQQIEMHVARNGRAFERMFRFRIGLFIDGAPLWDGEYFMGSGHALPDGSAPTPDLADVLHSVCSDASAYENAPDLLEFCVEYGYDLDTQEGRKSAREAFEGCKRAAHKLQTRLTGKQRATLQHLSSMI